MCVGVQLLMHILKPKCYIFVGFDFLKCKSQMYVHLIY